MELAEAKKALTEAKEKRSKECAQEIQDILKKHNCTLEVGIHVTEKGNKQTVTIIALED